MSKNFEVLGLPDTAAPAEIKARWRELCMIHHPDRGGDPGEFHRIRRAYKLAMEEALAPKPCATCGGTGKVKHSHGFSSIDMPCPACGGGGHD